MDQIPILFLYSVKAVGTVLLIAASGVLAVRFGIIKKDSLQLLSKLVFKLMLPCLLFSKISSSVDLARLKEFWILPVSCVIFISTGLMIGYFVIKLCKAEKEFFKPAVASIGFGNGSFIPIPLLTAVVLIFPAFVDIPNADAIAVSYISVYLIILSPMLWSLGYCLVSGKSLKEIKFSHIITPPLIGMLLGLIVGLIPFLKALFCTRAGLLVPVNDAAEIIGQATIPCALIVLGGRLSEGPSGKLVNVKIVVGVILAKLVLMPILAILYVKALLGIGIIPHDLLLILVLVTEAATPPATNLIVMCSLTGHGEDNMASLLFWTYLASIPSLTIFVMLTAWLFN